MLTRDQAKQLVQSLLDSQITEMDCEVAVIDSATLERPFGWVFFCQSKEYLLTGNYSTQLAGNSPLIVNRHTGQVVATGTAEPAEEYIARYEASLASGAA
ncbi:YrhB family protein [Xanthomonas prunicola]|uniref:YrhB family protein n=1 Tax=Xanthomonas prunicola TaxID=2053930 RepID=A0A9Q9MR92_9XANT|nr:YrhB family protein [Xanthomonas prunicola]UXA65158.1 YrhB family protein [Xanthomonas prunicola]